MGKGRFILFGQSGHISYRCVGRAFKITTIVGNIQAMVIHWLSCRRRTSGYGVLTVSSTGCWPPSVRGILVTEGVRGEGGFCSIRRASSFMFDEIPDLYRNSADNERKDEICQGDRNARRPPELPDPG